MKSLSSLGQVVVAWGVLALATVAVVTLSRCTSTPIAQADAGPVFMMHPYRVWEYKVLTVDSSSHEKTGPNALASNEVKPEESLLNSLGKEGWELTSSYLEMETAFPNLGEGKYITGIQPNVRPMRAVLIFKRSAP